MSSTVYSKPARPPQFGKLLREVREEKELPLRSVAASAEMDVAVLSKIELGQRLPTKEQTSKIAKFLRLNETDLQARRLAEKFRQENHDDPKAAQEAIQMLAEEAGIWRAEGKGRK